MFVPQCAHAWLTSRIVFEGFSAGEKNRRLLLYPRHDPRCTILIRSARTLAVACQPTPLNEHQSKGVPTPYPALVLEPFLRERLRAFVLLDETAADGLGVLFFVIPLYQTRYVQYE